MLSQRRQEKPGGCAGSLRSGRGRNRASRSRPRRPCAARRRRRGRCSPGWCTISRRGRCSGNGRRPRRLPALRPRSRPHQPSRAGSAATARARPRSPALEHQLQLLDLALDLLRGAAELLPAQPRELDLQLLDLERLADQAGLRRGKLGRLRRAGFALGDQHPLQRCDIRGQIVDRHGGIYQSCRRRSAPPDHLINRPRLSPPPPAARSAAAPASRCPPAASTTAPRVSRTTPSAGDGQMNRPRSRRLANRHSPCRVPVQRLDQIAAATAEAENDGPKTGPAPAPLWTCIASPSMPLRMSVRPQARNTFTPAGSPITRQLRARAEHGATPRHRHDGRHERVARRATRSP